MSRRGFTGIMLVGLGCFGLIACVFLCAALYFFWPDISRWDREQSWAPLTSKLGMDPGEWVAQTFQPGMTYEEVHIRLEELEPYYKVIHPLSLDGEGWRESIRIDAPNPSFKGPDYYLRYLFIYDESRRLKYVTLES